MIELIVPSQYLNMPWKNGGGITAQIALFPPQSTFPGDNFLWRISSAQVSSAGPFSQFPKCDRKLVIVKGEGLLLNKQKLLPYQPVSFPGESTIDCQLVSAPVEDLGIIYRRDLVQAEMTVFNVWDDKYVFDCSRGEHFFYCAEGELIFQNLTLRVGSTLHVVNEQSVSFRAMVPVKLIHISVCLD